MQEPDQVTNWGEKVNSCCESSKDISRVLIPVAIVYHQGSLQYFEGGFLTQFKGAIARKQEVLRAKPQHECLECDLCTKICAHVKMCDRVFTVLAKKATKHSIMALFRAASDEGASSTASGTQIQVRRCRPIHNLWRSR